MRRALVWLNLYSCEAVQQKLKNSLKTPKMHFLPVFELMSDSLTIHIGWATPMSFASINLTNPQTNQWNFHEKILRIGGAGKWGFFESAILNLFFQRNKNYFISMKTSRPFIWGIIYFCNMDGFFRILEKTSSKLICTRLYV